MVTCIDPKEANSSWAARGMLMGQSSCSSGGEPDSSTHKQESQEMLVVFVLAQGWVPLVVLPILALMLLAH